MRRKRIFWGANRALFRFAIEVAEAARLRDAAR